MMQKSEKVAAGKMIFDEIGEKIDESGGIFDLWVFTIYKEVKKLGIRNLSYNKH